MKNSTNSCRSERCPPISDAPFPSNHGDVSTISKQDNVCLVDRNLHILHINPCRHINYDPVVAIVRCKTNGFTQRGEVPAPVSGHRDDVTRVILLPICSFKDTTVLLLDPFRETTEPPARRAWSAARLGEDRQGVADVLVCVY